MGGKLGFPRERSSAAWPWLGTHQWFGRRVKVVLARFGGDTEPAGTAQCDPGRAADGSCGCQEQQVEVRAKKCRIVCLFNSILYLI